MSTSAQRRLLKDLKRIQNQPGDEIIASPQQNNLLKWTATIEGVEQTPWQGGLFQLKLQFSENYPNKPPNVRFVSEMFHPNIYNDGRICLDMLQNQWSPIYDVWSILTAIRTLLADPNTLSPANMVASNIFKDNKILYEQKVREIVEKSLDNAVDEDEMFKQEGEQKEEQDKKEIEGRNGSYNSNKGQFAEKEDNVFTSASQRDMLNFAFTLPTQFRQNQRNIFQVPFPNPPRRNHLNSQQQPPNPHIRVQQQQQQEQEDGYSDDSDQEALIVAGADDSLVEFEGVDEDGEQQQGEEGEEGEQEQEGDENNLIEDDESS